MFKKVISVNTNEVAKILVNEPIAIFQSRSEQGQRALGNRSLLMNPLHKDCIAKINKIKKREWFRPFAGTVSLEKAPEWFDMASLKESPFMTCAVDVKPDKQSKIPAITHVDGTCRIQTLKEWLVVAREGEVCSGSVRLK